MKNKIKKIEDESDLAIEGIFYTGEDWEKLVTIDLRDEGDLSSKKNVDAAIARQLAEAYEAFDVDEEVSLAMQGSVAEREARGVPDVERLLEDMQEQEARLNRFSEVADAVCEGRIIPTEEQPPKDGETIHITPQLAETIVFYLNLARKNNLGKQDIEIAISTLNTKMGKDK